MPNQTPEVPDFEYKSLRVRRQDHNEGALTFSYRQTSTVIKFLEAQLVFSKVVKGQINRVNYN